MGKNIQGRKNKKMVKTRAEWFSEVGTYVPRLDKKFILTIRVKDFRPQKNIEEFLFSPKYVNMKNIYHLYYKVRNILKIQRKMLSSLKYVFKKV